MHALPIIKLLLLSFCALVSGFFFGYALEPTVEFITIENYEEKTSTGIVVVEFWAQWNAKNQVSELGYVKNASVYRIDVDKNKNIIDIFNIRSIPTLIFYENGNEFYRYAAGIDFKGKVTAKDIDKIINNR